MTMRKSGLQVNTLLAEEKKVKNILIILFFYQFVLIQSLINLYKVNSSDDKQK